VHLAKRLRFGKVKLVKRRKMWVHSV
jgi:hypothetical protein